MTLLTTTSKILTTKSWLKLAQPTNLCRGCVAETGSSTVVHVLRVSTAARDVLLTVTDTGEAAHVVLVLHSSSAVRWRLAFVSREEGRTAERRTVALSPGSTVSTANVDVQGRQQRDRSSDRQIFLLTDWVAFWPSFGHPKQPNTQPMLNRGDNKAPDRADKISSYLVW